MKAQQRQAVVDLIKAYVQLKQELALRTVHYRALKNSVYNARKTVYVTAREAGYSYNSVRRMVSEAKSWS